jgi:hypothetical protein
MKKIRLLLENAELEGPFSESEIREAIFSSYSEGAPPPDGLPFLFYQKFWEYIKEYICDLVKEFQVGNLDLFRLNFALLTLIPKVENAMQIKKFRPISLLSCSFKIFGKLMASRLERVCQRLIAKEQNAFITGRYILESVVVAHEVVHSIYKSKDLGIIIKLDYEKAYDRVNLDFLMEIFRLRGFGGQWSSWISSVVRGGLVGVQANEEESNSFKTGKGLRQGTPCLPSFSI